MVRVLSGEQIFRKILVSVKFLSAILGPEMAAPILWAPRVSAFFLQENLHIHKIPRFREGYFGFGFGGGGADSIFMGAGIFLREFLKALETTTAMKRRKISCSFGSDC